MTRNLTTARLLIAAGLAASAVGTTASAKVYAEYNGAALIRNGFEGDSFGGVVGTQLGAIDIDAVGGGFLGADMFGEFDTANTELQIKLTIDPANVQDTIAVSLKDLDDPGFGDSFTYFFGLDGLPTGVPITLSRPLSEAPGTVGPGGGLFGAGDGIENYGLDQILFTAGYDETDALKISLDSISIVDPSDPTFFELDTDTFNNASPGPFPFRFGALGGSAVDSSGENFVVNATTGTEGGGFGIAGLPNYEFEADDHELQITAKLLGGNTVDFFRVVLGDVDGDDTGPGAGGENYFFDIDLSGFNTSDFATVTIPLGDGSQTDSGPLSGFAQAGNDLQDFDLNALSFRVLGEEGDVLNFELATIAIVEALGGLEGDYNGDGFVSQGDLDLVLLNWGDAVAPAGFEEGNIPGGGPFDSLMSQNELDGVLLNWGDGTPPAATTIPEPTGLALLGLGGLALLRRRSA